MKNTRFDIKVFIICLFLSSFFGVMLVRSADMPQFVYDYQNIGREDIIHIDGYDIKGNEFTATSDDPKIYINIAAYKNKNGVRINFGNISEIENVQMYYGEDLNSFTEKKSVYIDDVESNYVDLLICGKMDDFGVVRLDVNGNFTLGGIQIMANRAKAEVSHLREYAITFVICLCLSAVLAFVTIVKKVYEVVAAGVKAFFSNIWKNKKNCFLFILIVAMLAVVSAIVEKVICLAFDYEYYNKYEALLIFTGAMIVLASILLRKVTKNKPQYLFAIVVLLLGTFNIISSPKTVGISWDDEIHYGRTVYLSYGATGRIPHSDMMMINGYANVVLENHDYYTKDGRKEWLEDVVGHMEHNYMVDTDYYELNYSYVSNIVPAIGLIIGRGLGLSFKNVFMLGKFMHLLFYTTIFSLAISLLKKKGKYLLAVFGLIPTLVFLASSYSYDGWVVSLAVLSYAMFISELQKDNGKITMKKWIAIMTVMILALLPKAVYFPIIFPMLFIGKKKFDESHKYNRYVLVNLAAMFLLVLTFVLPMIIGGAGTGDMRGGSGVNSTEQIAFIFGNPMKYTGILLKFIGEYISLDSSILYLTYLGYYGVFSNFTICIAAIVFTACIDNRTDYSKQGKKFKGIFFFCMFATISLVSTALYISFTPVGWHTINGCQARYLLPILFPIIYFASEFNIDTEKMNKSLAVSLAIIAMAFVFLSGVGTLCVGYY